MSKVNDEIDRLQRSISATEDSVVAGKLFDELQDLLLENNMSENYFMSEEGRDLMMYLINILDNVGDGK